VATEKTQADWEAIERDYRAGVLSVREIASHHGVSHTAVQKRAKGDKVRQAWSRDLNAKIQARADALVAKREVATQVATERMATDRIVIEANAQRIAQVRGEHRADINRMRALVLRLLEECEAEAATPGLFASLGEIMASPDERGRDRAREAYDKAISLPQRIKGVKELAEALRVLVGMEREAYGITSGVEASGGDDGSAEVINTLKRLRGQGVRTALQPGAAMGFEDIDVG
jgi:hypothetical protein